MSHDQWVDIISRWNNALNVNDPRYIQAKEQAYAQNNWFTPMEIDRMFCSLKDNYLNYSLFEKWIQSFSPQNKSYNIGLIFAGNVPLVGFHDLLCVLATGNTATIKLSGKDQALYYFMKESLDEIDQSLASRIQFVDKLENFDAVIATGSDLSNNYFVRYFQSKPNLLRAHRNSVAILNGLESDEELLLLGEDVYSYFGLGCRNVSKLYVPELYDFSKMLQLWDTQYSYVSDHNKYRNNYDYQLALNLINGQPFLQGNTVLLSPSSQIVSPIACIFYETYTNIDALEQKINENSDRIQCVASNIAMASIEVKKFGSLQHPSLTDYADNLDTLEFLVKF